MVETIKIDFKVFKKNPFGVLGEPGTMLAVVIGSLFISVFTLNTVSRDPETDLAGLFSTLGILFGILFFLSLIIFFFLYFEVVGEEEIVINEEGIKNIRTTGKVMYRLSWSQIRGMSLKKTMGMTLNLMEVIDIQGKKHVIPLGLNVNNIDPFKMYDQIKNYFENYRTKE
ncbi:MAG: hypothetical protein ACXAC7_20285 [Candidatus Hodarchaeales archaeon]|jgi:hypothetical protein